MASKFGGVEIAQEAPVAGGRFGGIPEATPAVALVPRVVPAGEGVLATPAFTPLQQAVVSGVGGPLGLLAAQLRGRPVTQVEAAAEGALEEIGRLPGRTLEFGLTSLANVIPGAPILRQLAPELPQRFIQQISAPVVQAPETIENILGVGPSPERATFREPAAGAVGEFGAGFFPPVAAVPRAPEVAGRAVSRALQAGVAPIQRAVARVTPTAEQSAMSALRITSDEARDILPSAVTNLSKAAGKAAPTADEILKAAPTARQRLFDETKSGLNAAKEQGLVMKGGSAFDDVAAAIRSDSRLVQDEPETIARLIGNFEKYRRNIDPIEGQKLLEDTNKKLISHWDKTAKGQRVDLTDAEVRAERAFAANLSNQLDDLYKIGSKKNASPYRDIGKIIEFERNLKLEKEAAEQAFAQRVAPTRVRGAAAPIGRAEAARRTARGITSPLRKTEVELLDTNLKKAFRGTPKERAPGDLPEETISSLSRQYLPSATPPPIPVAHPTFAEQIEALVRTYPPSIRSDPTLARLAAEAELRQSGVTP